MQILHNGLDKIYAPKNAGYGELLNIPCVSYHAFVGTIWLRFMKNTDLTPSYKEKSVFLNFWIFLKSLLLLTEVRIHAYKYLCMYVYMFLYLGSNFVFSKVRKTCFIVTCIEPSLSGNNIWIFHSYIDIEIFIMLNTVFFSQHFTECISVLSITLGMNDDH